NDRGQADSKSERGAVPSQDGTDQVDRCNLVLLGHGVHLMYAQLTTQRAGPPPRTKSAMPTTYSRRRRGPKPERRRALELLAASPDGCSEAIMLAHGFTVDFLVDLIRTGMATTRTERVVAGGRAMEVARVRITEVGAAGTRGASMALILGRTSGSRP